MDNNERIRRELQQDIELQSLASEYVQSFTGSRPGPGAGITVPFPTQVTVTPDEVQEAAIPPATAVENMWGDVLTAQAQFINNHMTVPGDMLQADAPTFNFNTIRNNPLRVHRPEHAARLMSNVSEGINPPPLTPFQRRESPVFRYPDTQYERDRMMANERIESIAQAGWVPPNNPPRPEDVINYTDHIDRHGNIVRSLGSRTYGADYDGDSVRAQMSTQEALSKKHMDAAKFFSKTDMVSWLRDNLEIKISLATTQQHVQVTAALHFKGEGNGKPFATDTDFVMLDDLRTD